VTSSDPEHVLSRLGVNLEGVRAVLEVGPGFMHLADYLTALGKRVVVHDIVAIDDSRYVSDLPLKYPVDAAIAHLVLQHVEDNLGMYLDVLGSLRPGGKFYFDAISDDYEGPGIADELANGTSFPFRAWDLVDTKKEVEPGYFFCVAVKK
jgi:SAM-dependent methyltransferase